MPLTDHNALIDLPPWRRVRYTASARIKHWFGRHTYVATLSPVIDDEGLLFALNVSRECWVCEKLA